MRLDSFPAALVLILVLFLAGWAGLTVWADRQIASDAWLAPAALGGGEGAVVDPFALETEGTAAGASVEKEQIADNLTAALNGHLAWPMGAGAALALAWAAWCTWRKDRMGSAPQEQSGTLLWWGLFIALSVALIAFGWRASADPPIALHLSASGFQWLAIGTFLTTIVLFWLATALPTPNVLRQSVPFSGLLPLHGRSR
jgi:hypothetical protein